MNFKMRRLSLLIGLVCLEAFSQRPDVTLKKLDGSEITPKKIDGIVEKLLVYGKVDGLCLSVINGDKAYIKPYGYKNREKKELLDPETVLYAASFTKAVFAYLTLKLVEEKQIELDRPLYDYLGETIGDYPDWKPLESDENWKLIRYNRPAQDLFQAWNKICVFRRRIEAAAIGRGENHRKNDRGTGNRKNIQAVWHGPYGFYLASRIRRQLCDRA